ncbi:MAG: hypothetical protein ACXVFU_08700 [Nocardioidaceae bacterium]
MTTAFEETAWAWVDHLRHGGSTPWADWVATARPAPAAAREDGRRAGVLPGAAELELLRRLAGRLGGAPPAGFAALADLVLARSGPGRGLPRLPLPWPGAAAPAVGVPARDPSQVPLEELVRTGTGSLAELLLAGDAPPAPPARPPRRRPWSRQFHLAGAPVSTAGLRASLAAAGHVEGGRHPEVVLLAQPFDVHLAEVWSARVQAGSSVRWETFVARSVRRRELPPALRLAETGRLWAARVGPDKVHVLVAPADADQARRAVAVALGLRSRAAEAAFPLAGLPPAGTDVLRRLNKVLHVRVAPERQDAVRARAAGLLHAATTPLAVPDEHREWARTQAARLAEELAAGGYAVHGDLQEVAPRHRGGPAAPRRREVLDLVLDACLALAAEAPAGQEAW